MPPPPLPLLTPSPLSHPQTSTTLSLPLLTTLHNILPPSPALTLSIGSGSGLLEALLLNHDPSHQPSKSPTAVNQTPINIHGVEVLQPSSSPSPRESPSNPPHQSNITESDESDEGGAGETVNIYLPPSNLYSVTHSGQLLPGAEEAAAWLFVYPRSASLIQKYMKLAVEGGWEQSGGKESGREDGGREESGRGDDGKKKGRGGGESRVEKIVFIVPRNDYSDIVQPAKDILVDSSGAWREEAVIESGLAGWEMLMCFTRREM